MGTFYVIRYGDSGNRVKSVQKRLRALGYSCGAMSDDVTGDFDNETLLAVERYQRASGIYPADGVVDRKTWEKLMPEGNDYED